MRELEFSRCGHELVTVYIRDRDKAWEAIGALCRKCKHYIPDMAAPRRARPRPWETPRV